jgi:hypothetical protein
MTKTHLLPLQVGFQGEPNTLKKRYQIVIEFGVKCCLSVYTDAIVWVLENERVSNRTDYKVSNLKVGMAVTFKAINNEQFVGTIVELDRFGFAVVNLGMSESRIAVTKLAVA